MARPKAEPAAPSLYPKAKYDRRGTINIVLNKKEEDALDTRIWADSPICFGVITCPAEGQATYDPNLDIMPKDGE